MSKTTDFVFAAFLKLSEAEKNEMAGKINNYVRGSDLQKRSILNETPAISFGPQGAGCPICGK